MLKYDKECGLLQVPSSPPLYRDIWDITNLSMGGQNLRHTLCYVGWSKPPPTTTYCIPYVGWSKPPPTVNFCYLCRVVKTSSYYSVLIPIYANIFVIFCEGGGGHPISY